MLKIDMDTSRRRSDPGLRRDDPGFGQAFLSREGQAPLERCLGELPWYKSRHLPASALTLRGRLLFGQVHVVDPLAHEVHDGRPARLRKRLEAVAISGREPQEHLVLRARGIVTCVRLA